MYIRQHDMYDIKVCDPGHPKTVAYRTLAANLSFGVLHLFLFAKPSDVPC